MPPVPESDYQPIEQFPIPDEVKEYLRSKNISKLNKAQIQAIADGLLEDGNFVASTFTGTGKTVLAHIKMAQTLKGGKKMIYIAPLKSIVMEKARQDFKFYEKYGWKFVDSTDLTENERNRIKYEDYDGIIMTYEKFDSILNKTGALVDWLADVGLVVVDEGHEISDEERGAGLESALTKIRILSKDRIKILLLSAVLPNVKAVAKWLNARYCNIEWRPVDLDVGVVLFGGEKKPSRNNQYEEELNRSKSPYLPEPESIVVKTSSVSRLAKFQARNPLPDVSQHGRQMKIHVAGKWLEAALPKSYTEDNVTDPVWPVVKRTLAENGQALVFCNSRPNAEKKAAKLAAAIAFQRDPHSEVAAALQKAAGRKKKKSAGDEQPLQQTLPAIFEASELPLDADPHPDEENEEYAVEKPKEWSLEQYAKYLKRYDSKLYGLVMNGVAYHHAGLSLQARSAIEQAYRERKIKVIVSTPTLIAGVNLPARLVIFDSVERFDNGSMKRIPKKEFVNGCGRAGRVGLDNVGIALFVDKDLVKAAEYINKPVEEVGSELTRYAIFQILCTIKRNEDRGADYTTLKEINEFFEMTFSRSLGVNIPVEGYIETLLKYGLIEPNPLIPNAYNATPLGAEGVNYYLQPGTAYIFSLAVDAIKAMLEKKGEWNPQVDETSGIHSVKVPEALTLRTIIHTIAQTKEFTNHRKVSDKARIYAYSEYYNKEFIINWKEEDAEPEVIGAVMALMAKLEMYDMIEEYMPEFVELYQSFGDGDFNTMKENMDWLLEAMLSMARVKLGHNSQAYKTIAQVIINLKKRMKKWIREELLEVCRIKNVGRKKGLLLKKARILTLQDIANPANKKALQETLGLQFSEHVIESASKLLSGVRKQ